MDEPVVIPAIMLSDHVIKEAGTGKLSLIGVFSFWNCPAFPFRTPGFWVTAFLTNFRKPEGEINLTARIEQSASGHVLASALAKINVHQNQTIPEGAMLEIPFSISSIQLNLPGLYRIIVLVNDEKLAERGFMVNSAPPHQPRVLPQ